MNEKPSLFNLLNFHPISCLRRNHALEHATIQILSEGHPELRLVGRSSLWGFYIYGDVVTETVLAAAREGLRRLQAGQHHLAIHPNCGSNLVVSGALAGLGAFLALGGTSPRRGCVDRIIRLPLACAAATLGILLARPLGPLFQARVTTQPDVGDLRLVDVTRERKAGILVHHVRTKG